jgi:predicted  nucleic acid-binding Zn-ribbon protein
MIAELERVLDLQRLDRRLGELEREIAELPKQIAAIEKLLEGHLRKLDQDKAALAANQSERKKLDGEIQMQQQKISKLRDQTLQAKTNEQYRAFQNEIAYAENEIKKFEDRILVLMEQSEPLDSAVKKADLELKKEKETVEAQKKVARERTAIDQAEAAKVREERTALYGSLPTALQRDYDRLRKKWKNGVVASDATDGLCSACHLSLRPQHFQELRRGDQILHCENCGRLLIYNPPVDIEQLAGPA